MSTLVGRVPGIVDAHAHFFDPRTPPWSLQRLGRASVPVLKALPRPLIRVASRFTDEHSLSGIAGPGRLSASYRLREYAKDLAALDTVAGVPVTTVIPVDSQWRRRLSPEEVPGAVTRDLDFLRRLPYGDGLPELGGLLVPADDRIPGLGVADALDADVDGLIRGFRLRWGRHHDPLVHDWTAESDPLRSKNFRDAFGPLADRGLVFESLCYSHQLGELASLASEYPKATIVVEHLGCPVGVFGPFGSSVGTTAAARADILGLWRERMAMLAARPNVHVKISAVASGLFGYGQERSGNIGGQHILADMIGPLVLHVVDRFGPERVIFGSNAPLDTHNATIGVVVGALLDVLGDRGDHLLSHLFNDNARRLYRITDQ
ncbi:amidohydrolase family protein [Gordonia sp. PP30]|uniref:amidohydrolase family protein n=1 Tax=Gordonia sp. PP30 TaxID=2935861 RepID=UPI001FFFF966|nr:amidohydrolase family protein [Gordonia sp. PP30]UQE75446.1 amidohydrolase family protein [Gordonia sp. PP30]